MITKRSEFPEYPHGMHFKLTRLQSFTNWRYPETSPCSSLKLAEAGFYSVNGPEGSAACWVCHKTMIWDEDDDPCQEHIKHCPDCLFVKVAINKEEGDLTLEELTDLAAASHVRYHERFMEYSLQFLDQGIKRIIQKHK